MKRRATFLALLSAVLLVPGCAFEDDGLAHDQQELGFSTIPLCPSPCTGPTCKGSLSPFDKELNYYANFSLVTRNECVRQAVIVVHGRGRHPDDYFRVVTEAAAMDYVGNTTLIVAPHFVAGDDPRDARDYYWDDQGWKQGDASENGTPRLSSMDVLDYYVQLLGNRTRFPNLQTIVVTGHSAGGQLVQRYAVGTAIDESLDAAISMRFVPANPSSYVYLDATRPNPIWCLGYDNYRYGMRKRNSYMTRFSTSTMVARYRAREVAYFIGARDTKRTESLDTSCQADTQGVNRRDRAQNYLDRMNAGFSPHSHYLRLVPEVEHDVQKMYKSVQGRILLFH